MMQGIENWRIDDPADAEVIAENDWVRSYDFEERDDCYVLGLVEEVGVEVDACPRYRIRVVRRVFGGEHHEAEDRSMIFARQEVFPPVNGVPSSLGRYMNGVRKLDPEEAKAWSERLRDHAEDLRGDC